MRQFVAGVEVLGDMGQMLDSIYPAEIRAFLLPTDKDDVGQLWKR
ncbi:hypothetical protein [Novipirellula artificiosorum]|uniref:Uncharacterized protein n=1 Tax=Novipirellula artificiosorum TaxID=2528016 RepID=A0A5C6E126_9BACT|nr:hypothetical protein [Novipirellula artificiosorum]TWU42582.1 hypothetical protein Poly41_08790 [Novipirellula artificiosorum]